MNDRRSRIRYSVCSSVRLWSDCSTTILNFKIAWYGLRPAVLLRASGFVSVTLSMSARKSSHRTIFLIVSNGSPLALIASSLRSTSKKPVCPMTRSLDPPMAHCGQRVRFVATWREEFFEVPASRVAARPGKAGAQPMRDRVSANAKGDRDRRGRSFGRPRRRIANRSDNGDATADEVGHERRQAVVFAVQPMILHRHVLALYVAGFGEAFTERACMARGAIERPTA